MPNLSTAAKVYQDFIDIDGEAYRTLVRFYESNTSEINLLKFDAYFEILVNYSNALFEIGAYAKHVEEVDQIIHLSIEQNIKYYKGEDIYFKSLFQKAASYYHLLEYSRAEHILKELLKMSPKDSLSIRYLKKCLIKNQPSYFKYARASCIFLFFLTALISAIEVLFIHPFAEAWSNSFEIFRFSIFLLGIIVLVGTYCFRRYQVNRIVNAFLLKVRDNNNLID